MIQSSKEKFMHSRSRYYESHENFERLVKLDENAGSGISRNRALHSVLDVAPSGFDILDAGCGLGGFSRHLCETNRVTGVDLNNKCLDVLAKQRAYTTLHFDLEEKWPIPSSSFDLILLGDVLEHLYSTVDVLAQANNVLRPNGRIAVAVPNVGYWRRRIRLLVKGELSKDSDEHIRFFSLDSLTRIARLAGLEVVNSCPYQWNSTSAPKLPATLAWGFVALLKSRDGSSPAIGL
jgi:2-polyprenyl-3-methyl-5-hydroxy-6-metoxy-1,4-benzoquinol methylase